MPEPKLVRLHDRLFIRGHTKSLAVPQLVRVLHRENVHMILNVAIIPDLFLEEFCRNIGMTYMHEPMSDSKREMETEKVERLINTVATNMKIHGVLVHCDSGKNRSCLIAIPALHKFTGEPTSRIIESLRLVRPQVLDNPAFEKFVREYNGR